MKRRRRDTITFLCLGGRFLCLLTISFQTVAPVMQSADTARAHTICTATLRYFGIKKVDILYIISVSKSSSIRCTRCGWRPPCNQKSFSKPIANDPIGRQHASMRTNPNSALGNAASNGWKRCRFWPFYMVANKTAPLKKIVETDFF